MHRTLDQIARLPSDIDYNLLFRPYAPPTVVLFGDPEKPGMYVTRSKFWKGYREMPAYPPGTFFTESCFLPHFMWAKEGEVTIQVTALGPLTTTPAIVTLAK
jgi:hypothetical protein